MHLRAGDHQPRRLALQHQGQQALQQQLMGQVVHGDRELKTLRRPARFAGAAVLQAGVQHQAVDRLCRRQEIVGATLDAGEIRQIGDRGCQLAPEGFAPLGFAPLGFAPLGFSPLGPVRRLGQQLAEAIGAGDIAAEDGEVVTGRQQLLGGLVTDA